VTPESLVRTVEDFLTSARDAVIIEDGAVVFDLAQSKYSISGERNRCLLHLWRRNEFRAASFGSRGEERNPPAGSATAWTGETNQAGDLPRTRPSNAHRDGRRARGVPASAATGAAAPLSWLYRGPAELVDEIWSDLLRLGTREACYAEGNLLLPFWA
jgi:hypothetical protein